MGTEPHSWAAQCSYDPRKVFMVVFTSCSFWWALARSSLFILSHEESRSSRAETLLPVKLENLPTGSIAKKAIEKQSFLAHITVITLLSNGSFLLYDIRWIMQLMMLMDTRKAGYHIQAGCGSGQPGLMVGDPAHGIGLETRWPVRSFST